MENRILIANRIPKSRDKWELVDGNETRESLTDILELFFQKTKYRGDFILSPSTSKLYIIEEVEIPQKKFNLYGDEE